MAGRLLARGCRFVTPAMAVPAPKATVANDETAVRMMMGLVGFVKQQVCEE